MLGVRSLRASDWLRDCPWKGPEHLLVHFRVHCEISREHCRGSVPFYTDILNFRGHFRGHLRVHSRVHFREHFRERERESSWVTLRGSRALCFSESRRIWAECPIKGRKTIHELRRPCNVNVATLPLRHVDSQRKQPKHGAKQRERLLEFVQVETWDFRQGTPPPPKKKGPPPET